MSFNDINSNNQNMKIIEEIIDEISNGNTKLTDILIKTKVLAFKLKNKELISWIDSELNGYNSEDIPDYRILKCQIIGSLSNGFKRAMEYPIPLSGIDEDIASELTTINLYQSISTLDHFIYDEESNKFAVHVPAKLCNYISTTLGNGYQIEYAKKQIDIVQITQVITAIKSKLLDFLLNLNEEIGDEAIESFLHGQSKEKVEGLFHSTVFGNNATIIIGDNNKQKVKNITQGDFKNLESILKSNGVSEQDIQDLEIILIDDNQNNQKQEFGDKVKAWISKMLISSMNGMWNINVGAAGELLADGIKSYYGWM
jgi:hypothetical protein